MENPSLRARASLRKRGDPVYKYNVFWGIFFLNFIYWIALAKASLSLAIEGFPSTFN